MWYIYIQGNINIYTYKGNFLLFAGKWVEIESIMERDTSQIKVVKGHVFSNMWKLQKKRKKRWGSDLMKTGDQ